jgi:hypothetical protein
MSKKTNQESNQKLQNANSKWSRKNETLEAEKEY